MPRFYIHVQNQTSYTRDENGSDLPDLGAAHLEAVRAAAGITAEDMRAGKDDVKLALHIENADGERQMTVETNTTVRVESA